MPGARALALSVLGMAIHLATLALAAAPKVVLVGPSAQHPTIARMRDELGLLGIEVEFVTLGDDTRDLPTVARGRGAVAAACVESASQEIVLWVDPARSEGDPASAELHVREARGGLSEPGLLPLRAVELLRGRLLPAPRAPSGEAAFGQAAPDGAPAALEPASNAAVEAAADAAPGEALAGEATSASAPIPPLAPLQVPPAPPEDSQAARPLRRAPEPLGCFALHLSAAVLMSPGGVPAMPGVRFGAEWSPVPRIGVEALSFLPVLPGVVVVPEGDIDLRAVAFGAQFRGTLNAPEARLSLALGLGLGAMLLLFEGHASGAFVSAHGSQWVPAPLATITARYNLHPRLALRADVLATLARPEPVVRVAERHVASFGQPAMFLAFGVEARP